MFNTLPLVISLVLNVAVGFNLNFYIGQLHGWIMALQVGICSAYYWAILRRRKQGEVLIQLSTKTLGMKNTAG
ncbi:hypothetical protein DdX_14424 [Ditylenchus destructor]|uniref:Uncharacterized protein n=1 Tax=Ditylenchus destructor TaxID=166010 RepID=A0AAD4MUM7_9BILA|nr:hypothetical protein DdX_14424 [Ditylenchus destructor]